MLNFNFLKYLRDKIAIIYILIHNTFCFFLKISMSKDEIFLQKLFLLFFRGYFS